MGHHSGIATVAIRAPLEVIHVQTLHPEGNEILVQNEFTTAGPLELHQSDGGLLVNHPQLLGDAISGTVVSVGHEVKDFAIGDKVFGFCMGEQKNKAWQAFVVVPDTMLAKLPENISQEEATTIPTNFVTAFHTVVTELGVALPWPHAPVSESVRDKHFLVWGGSSSVGQFTIQVLKHWGFTSIIAVASKRQHAFLRGLGATKTLDYSDKDVISELQALGDIRFVIDCIGSKDKSVGPISQVVKAGAKVATMLPVIVRDASKTEEPIYEMDVGAAATWAEGVQPIGVRTHFYQKNRFHREKLQREIMPALVANEVITPQRVKLIEGKDMLESAMKCLELLRGRAVSGEKLVFKLNDR